MDAATEVMEAATARATALADGDADRLSDLLHEDFRWTSHTGETYDRREYVRRNTRGQVVWRSQQLGHAEVTVVDGTAVLRTQVEDVVLSGGGADRTYRMPMTQVWVRVGEDWKCLAGHAGPRSS